MSLGPLDDREVIFEFQRIGTAIKVVAVDVLTMTEIILQAPLNTPETTLKREALNKLAYVLRKAGKIPE